MPNLSATTLDATARTLGNEQLWYLGYMEGYCAKGSVTITQAIWDAIMKLPPGDAYTATGRAAVKAVLDGF